MIQIKDHPLQYWRKLKFWQQNLTLRDILKSLILMNGKKDLEPKVYSLHLHTKTTQPVVLFPIKYFFSGWSVSSDKAESLGVRLEFMKEGQHHRNKSADWSELSRIHYPRRVLTPTERYVESFTIESHQ